MTMTMTMAIRQQQWRWWSQLYNKWGFSYPIATPPSEDEIVDQAEEGRTLMYLPIQLSTSSALVTLAKAFPLMKTLSWGDDPEILKTIDNVDSPYGWLSVERSAHMLDYSKTVKELREIFSNQGAVGMTVNIYIIYGQLCRFALGYYPDVYGDVRLIGSIKEDNPIIASFAGDGSLEIKKDFDWHAGTLLGARSVVTLPRVH